MTGVVAVVALTAELVASATGGRLIAGAGAAAFTGVAIDSRAVTPGVLFVALPGTRTDGHAFVADAIARGAAGVLVSQTTTPAPGAAVILVPDVLAALQAVGREVRRRSGATLIAITGSAGKTTTKELLADLLSARYRTFRNRGNLNNHIGLPLSLTELASGSEMAVVELGMNHAGEIRDLVAMADPQVRVWTNVGDAHIGHFGSSEALAAAKAEILEGATPATVAVVNADDARVMAQTAGFPGRVVTFGVGPAATVRATRIVDRGFDGSTAEILTPAGPIAVTVALPGPAHLLNVLAAVAVATELGIDRDAIRARVAQARAVARRGSEVRLANGARVIDDSYNASPAATAAMLQALAATPATGRRIAVLGEMLELGADSRARHHDTGGRAVESGVDLLVAVGGPAADGLISGAVAAGLPADRTRRFATAAAACAPIAALIRPGDLVLVKGSRGTGTDLIVDALAAGDAR